MYISEKKTYQWGIIGNSTEAEDFATAIHDLIDAKLYSVALDQKKSSSVRTALSTAQDVYSSFEEVILEKEIDLVYVASSTDQRLDHIKAALACKKGVVYLPPLQIKEKEWDELCTTAKENGLLLLEGITSRFLPPIHKVSEVVAQGSIGEVCALQADASHVISFDPQHPFFNAKEGGILRQHGLYPLFFAANLLGLPEQISGQLRIGLTGIEEQYALVLHYPKGVYAILSASAIMHGNCEAQVIATKSRVQIHAPFYGQTKVSLYNKNRPSGLMPFSYQSNSYAPLVKEAQKCHASHQHESKEWGHAHTRLFAQLLKRCRTEATIYQESS